MWRTCLQLAVDLCISLCQLTFAISSTRILPVSRALTADNVGCYLTNFTMRIGRGRRRNWRIELTIAVKRCTFSDCPRITLAPEHATSGGRCLYFRPSDVLGSRNKYIRMDEYSGRSFDRPVLQATYVFDAVLSDGESVGDKRLG